MTLDHLSPAVKWVLAGVVVALAAASAATILLARRRPERDWSELRLRVRTWWVIVGLFALAMLLGRTGAIVFFALVSGLALREFFTLIPPRAADWRILLTAYLCIPIQYLWVYEAWYGMFIIFIPVYALLFLPAQLVLMGRSDGFTQTTSDVHWGLMTTVFSISHAAYLFVLEAGPAPRWQPQPQGESDAIWAGPGLLLFLVLLTELNDIFQYLWGKALGRIRIAPAISPGKTLAGLVGGLATTTALAAVLGPWLTFMDAFHSLLGGLLIAVSGVAGDLSVSAIKRDLGVKDSGTTLPGHGGILDRVDSLTYSAPLFFHYVWFGYG